MRDGAGIFEFFFFFLYELLFVVYACMLYIRHDLVSILQECLSAMSSTLVLFQGYFRQLNALLVT